MYSVVSYPTPAPTPKSWWTCPAPHHTLGALTAQGADAMRRKWAAGTPGLSPPHGRRGPPPSWCVPQRGLLGKASQPVMNTKEHLSFLSICLWLSQVSVVACGIPALGAWSLSH